jgi:hypothetical protein
MATRSQLLKYQVFTNAAMSGTSTITSPVTNIQFLDLIGYQMNFTGTPTGTFQVQISIDYAQDNNGNVTNPGNWDNMALSPTPVAAGASGIIYVDIIDTSAPWIRLQYTNASGTGTLNAFITAKVGS